MNILHIIPSLDPSTGGPARIAIRLAAGAATLGHQVTILSYASANQKATEQDLAVVPGAALVHKKFLPQPGRLERLTARGAKATIGPILKSFDVVHTHDAWSAISRASMSMAFKKSVPFVLLPNGMFDPWSMQQKGWKKSLVLTMGYRRLLNEALFIHTGNIDEKNGVEQVGITAAVEIIPNGVYQQEFDPLPMRGLFYAAHPELAGRPYILFLSRLHYKKGLDYLAGAFERIAGRHPRLQLVVAGPDEGAGEPFRQAVAAAGLADRVHMIGPVFSKERFNALIDCACFCLPSRQEGFSIAILEALACGRPVVITTACHFPEVASTGAGEVVSLEVSAIAEALDRILTDPLRAEAMGEVGRKLVLTQYTWPTIAGQLVAAYHRHLV
jgi:glycosyltransferase involved in cell wall biosynthesis